MHAKLTISSNLSIANINHQKIGQTPFHAGVSDEFIYLVRAESPNQKGEYEWADVQVYGQFGEGYHGEPLQSCMLFCMHDLGLFNNQPTRLFLRGFYVCSSTAQLWVFDRAGAFSYTSFNIEKDPI